MLQPKFYMIYILAQIVPTLTVGSPFLWLLCPLTNPMVRVCVCVFTRAYFLALEDGPGSPPAFPAPALESAISPRSLGSLFWAGILEIKLSHWMCSLLGGTSLLPSPLS